MECDVSLNDHPNSNHNDHIPSYEIISSNNYQITSHPTPTTHQSPIRRSNATNHIPNNNHDTDRPPILLPEDEDPLALDDLDTIDSSLRLENPPKLVKHTHCLRRHVPRLNIKSTSERSPSSIEKTDKQTRTLSAQASTMREVLASIPGFSMKPRRRSNKKMSTAAQIEQTKDGKIDLETPDSVLAGTNLRALLNKHTFSMLPPLFQHNLIQLLPSVDRSPIDCDPASIRLSSSSLNNEFFARACLEWRDRLAEGEFTPENQMKLKTEAEKEKSKLDPWKLKHFEPMWGSKRDRLSLKTTIKLKPPTTLLNPSTPSTSTGVTGSPAKYTVSETNTTPQPSSSNSPKRIRTVGAITRAQQQQALVSSSEISQQVEFRDKDKDECDSGIEEISTGTTSKIDQFENLDTAGSLISAPNDIVETACVSKMHGRRIEESNRIQDNDTVIFKIEISTVDTISGLNQNSDDYLLKNPIQQNSSSSDYSNENPLKLNNDVEYKTNNSTEASRSSDMKIIDRYSDDNDNAAAESYDEKTCNTIDDKLDLSKNILSNDYNQLKSSAGSGTSNIDQESTDHIFGDMYKLQNFNGLLQNAFNIQNTSMFANQQQQQQQPVAINQISQQQQHIHQISTSTHDITDSFIVSDLTSGGGVGAMLTCSDETTSSGTSGLVDCSGDNTTIEDLEPSIQNLPIEDDPIEQKFADAENYVLESGNNDDYSMIEKRAPKRSSSPEYNDRKQLKFNETATDRREQNDGSTTASDDQKDEELLVEMRDSDTDNADTLDEKTCNSVDLDIKLELDNEILYSNKTEKIHQNELISSDYRHNDNNLNQATTSEVEGIAGSTVSDNIFADMYKLQNFNGLLQTAFNIQQNFAQAVGDVTHQMPTSSSQGVVDSFIVSNLANGGDGDGGVGAMLTCSEETSSSTSGLIDCSGDNSADDNAIEELEQTIQNIPIEDDPIEQKFADAEHYVMESGEISTDSGDASSLAIADVKIKEDNDVYEETVVGQAMPSVATMALVRNSNVNPAISNYDLHHISQRKQQEQQQQQQQLSMCTTSSNSQSTCSVSISGNSSSSSSSMSSTNSTMPETITKEDIYHHDSHDWNYGIKLESNQSGMGGNDSLPDGQLAENLNQCNSGTIIGHLDDSNTVRDTDNIYHNHLHDQHHQILYETESSEQIKLENEIPMTAAEMEVSSTVASNSNDSSSDQSLSDVVHSNNKTGTQPTNSFIVQQTQQTNVSFPQNTIVQQQLQNCSNSQLTGQYLNQIQQQPQQITFNFQSQPHSNLPQHYIENQQQIQSNIQMPSHQQQPQIISKLVRKSSSPNINNNTSVQQQRNSSNVPSSYLSLSSSQPLKVIPNVLTNPGIPTTIAQQRPKVPPTSGKGRRSSNKLPPGAVNLERSYQICQAVIQNSPNRHQLTAQLRPPPSLLAANNSSSSSASNSNSPTPIKKDIPIVTSSNRTVYKVIGPRLGFPKKKFTPRHPSPTSLIRHVYTTNTSGGVPSANPGIPTMQQQQVGQLQAISGQQQQQSALIQGQYVLIHRANVGAADNQAPRASSAPPAQNQQIHGVNGVPISGRGRPASVDVDSPNSLNEMHMAVPNPGVQAVTRRTINNQGLSYCDTIMDSNHQNYMANTGGENTSPNCPCSLNPMVICQQCGAFCHDDCISPSKLCIECVIR